MTGRRARRSWRRIGRAPYKRRESDRRLVYSWSWIFNYVYYGLLWILFVCAAAVLGLRARGIDIPEGTGIEPEPGARYKYVGQGNFDRYEVPIVFLEISQDGRYAFSGTGIATVDGREIEASLILPMAEFISSQTKIGGLALEIRAHPKLPFKIAVEAAEKMRMAGVYGVSIASMNVCADKTEEAFYAPKGHEDWRHELRCIGPGEALPEVRAARNINGIDPWAH